MPIVVGVVIGVFALGIVMMLIEMKKAPIVNDKEPFLSGDYDPKKRCDKKSTMIYAPVAQGIFFALSAELFKFSRYLL